MEISGNECSTVHWALLRDMQELHITLRREVATADLARRPVLDILESVTASYRLSARLYVEVPLRNTVQGDYVQRLIDNELRSMRLIAKHHALGNVG